MPNEKLSSSRRLKMIVAYDGASFAGWQSQASGNTIQDQLEYALKNICGRKIRVHGAGRTDAGVHALGQCAHVDLSPTKLPAEIWRNALNASLPPQIRIRSCRFVRQNFHARFSARGKIYRYRIATTAVLLPFELGRAWHVTAPLDDAALRACSAIFLGAHDFAGFAANRGSLPESTVRTIRKITVRRTAALTTIELDGDGFLYKMVRLIVGAMVACATGKSSLARVREILQDPKSGKAKLVAPAGGLTLLRVRY